MPVVLVLVAALVCAGAVAAVSAVRPLVAVLGAAVAVAGAGLVADPTPGAPALLAGIVSAGLTAYLGWAALRDVPQRQDAAPGSDGVAAWPGAVGIGIAAFLAGWLTATAIGRAIGDSAGAGPTLANVAAGLVAGSPVARAAVGAAFALAALALAPVLLARDILRLGLGLLLLVAAVELLRASLGGQADDAVTFAFAALYAAGAGGLAAVTSRSLARHGDLELRSTGTRGAATRGRRRDEAHPARPAK